MTFKGVVAPLVQIEGEDYIQKKLTRWEKRQEVMMLNSAYGLSEQLQFSK